MADWCIDHEAGDLSEYDTTVTDAGDLSAHADAAWEGSYGLRAVIDDTTGIYAIKTFTGKSRLRVGFFFDPNGVTMGGSDEFMICADSSASDYKLELSKPSGYEVTLAVRLDDDTWSTTAAVAVADDWQWIEIDIYISSEDDDGFCKLWVDSDVNGSPDAENTGLNNDTKSFNDVRLGAFATIDATTSGTIYFDYLCANDDGSAIGPLGASPSPSLSPSSSPSPSVSPSLSPSSTPSSSPSPSLSPSASISPSASMSPSPSGVDVRILWRDAYSSLED